MRRSKRGVFILLIAAAFIIAFLTKPGRDDFSRFIQTDISRSHIPPVIDFQDKFLYTKAVATYVDVQNPVQSAGRVMAPARQETYIGAFGKFWKMQQ